MKRTPIYAAIVMSFCLIVGSGADPVFAETCFATTTPSGFTFSHSGPDSGAFTDAGVVSSVRRINFASPSNTGDYGDLTYTITGLTSGVSYTIAASSSESAGTYSMGNVQILADGSTIVNVGASMGGTASLSGSATSTATSMVVKLRLAAQSLGGGVSHTEDWFNVLVTAPSCNPAPTPTTIDTGMTEAEAVQLAMEVFAQAALIALVIAAMAMFFGARDR